jgi:hypothetical protein
MTSGEQFIASEVIVTALAAGYNDQHDVERKRTRRCGRCSLKKKVAASVFLSYRTLHLAKTNLKVHSTPSGYLGTK